MKTNKVTRTYFPVIVALLISIMFVSACDKAQEVAEQTADKVVEKTDQVVSETADKMDQTDTDALEKTEMNENFLLGTWNGKFDNRNTVLKITSQDGDNFSGKITINYRDVINQEVKGVYNSETQTITMKDQLHSRYQGSYSGKLSEDKTIYSGEFTMKLDGKKFNFNLKKK